MAVAHIVKRILVVRRKSLVFAIIRTEVLVGPLLGARLCPIPDPLCEIFRSLGIKMACIKCGVPRRVRNEQTHPVVINLSVDRGASSEQLSSGPVPFPSIKRNNELRSYWYAPVRLNGVPVESVLLGDSVQIPVMFGMEE